VRQPIWCGCETFCWIEIRVPRNAAAAIGNAIRSLDLFPERGRQSGAGDTRELVVPFGRSAYIVRYAILTEAKEIVILRVWHGREQRD